MKVAIYARKSRASEQGESIQNQIDMCKNYASTYFEGAKFEIYKDDGFSGGNIDRPQFQLLLKELKKGSYDTLMCYRLDRISRNVSDFSSTLDILTKNETGFVSIKENFDTTTPMGRAMIHVSSVFAQLERETIAERIKDNMMELARTGRWLGGVAPTGFKTKKESFIDGNGNKKEVANLVAVPEEQKLIKTIFNKYIELDSIAKVVTYCIQNDIKSRNSKQIQPGPVCRFLENPVYCVADQAAYDYFIDNKCNVEGDKESYNGNFGIMSYNRTDQSNNKLKRKDMSEWVIALGKHQGVIDSEKWIKVQGMLEKNSHKAIRGDRPGNALLSPLLRCGKCGSRMLVTSQAVLADGTPAYYYKCQTKVYSKGKKCDIKNVAGHRLDQYVIDNLKGILKNEKGLNELLEKQKNSIMKQKELLAKDEHKIKSEINKNKNAIDKLIMMLVDFSDDPNIKTYVQEKVNVLHDEKEKLNEQLLEIKNNSETVEVNSLNVDIIKDSLLNFNQLIDSQDVPGKRKLIHDIVKRIEWDGKEIHMEIFLDKLDYG